MKTKIFFQLLILTALIFTGCARFTQVKPEAGTTTAASQAPRDEMIGAESDQAGVGICARSTDGTLLFINTLASYCLQYPPEYDIALINPQEVMFFKDSILNAYDPNFHIDVQPANGLTVEQAADWVAENYAIPGQEPARTELSIGGEKAIMLDGLTGQDPNRRVVILHKDVLYNLYFMQTDRSQPELYAQEQLLYDTVIRSFNFRPESNVCADCPPTSDTQPETSQSDPMSAMISGWVWHDQCDTGMDGEPPITTAPEGCIEEGSPIGQYHADGELSADEPLIEGVIVTLGEGACPATRMAEYSTITSDLSYSFSGLKAGTYCVYIDPQREPNFTILRPGVWTYPAVSQDIISDTVTLAPGEYKGMVNFGWDYQFQP